MPEEPIQSAVMQQGSSASSPDLWQLVVVGTIDHRQHHPGWYKLIGCLNDNEASASSNTFFAGPAMYAFDAGPFAILCAQDNWRIQTVVEQNRGRIIDVACTVFQKLNELHIPAYGINKVTNTSMGTNSPLKLVARKIYSADLGLPFGDADCLLQYTTFLGEFRDSINIGASPFGENFLNVTYNRHYQIDPQSGPYYDIGEMIKRTAEPAWSAASLFVNKLTDKIKGIAE